MKYINHLRRQKLNTYYYLFFLELQASFLEPTGGIIYLILWAIIQIFQQRFGYFCYLFGKFRSTAFWEILRATVMQTYESVPFDKAFGTILAERVVDLVVLFALIILCFFGNRHFTSFIREKISLDFNNQYILVISIIFLLMIFIFKRFFENGIKKLSNIMFGIRDGFISLLKMNHKIQYLIHTIFIWCIYILVFYIMKFSLNGTELLDFKELLIAFIFGALSMTTTNGGIGVYPISDAKQIFSFKGVS